MQLYELEQIFEETSSHHWEVTSGGPMFLHSYQVTSWQGNEPQITAVEEHHTIAVLRGDIDVRIAWGYDPDFGEKEEYNYFKEHTFPDPSVYVRLAMSSIGEPSYSAIGSWASTGPVRSSPCQPHARRMGPLSRVRIPMTLNCS